MICFSGAKHPFKSVNFFFYEKSTGKYDPDFLLSGRRPRDLYALAISSEQKKALSSAILLLDTVCVQNTPVKLYFSPFTY